MAFDPITAILNLGNSVIDRVLPDKAANDAAKAQLVQMQLSGELAQITGQLEVNKVEAASSSMFVAGWRPFVGWVCGSGLAYQFIARPLLMFVVALFGHPVVAPELDMGTLLTLLLGMLGLAGARTFEKVNGVASGH
jgi:ABC-type sulfate transport system permease component